MHFIIFSGLFHLITLIAPILSFTAEETWEHLTGDTEGSVLLQLWHVFPQQYDVSELQQRWQSIRTLRAKVLKKYMTRFLLTRNEVLKSVAENKNN